MGNHQSQLESVAPRTGQILKTFERTALHAVPQVFERAKAAQKNWANTSFATRRELFLNLRDRLVDQVDALQEIIHQENGKPKFEALSSEILPSLELLTYFLGIAERTLAPKEISFRNPLMGYRRSTVIYQPIGVVAVISPWNYPFYLAFGDIVVSILAGNAVVFKPSEYSLQVGEFIQKLFDEAGFPKHLLTTLFGEGDLGAAVVGAKPGKIFFTGSVPTGKKIMRQASDELIPVVLELGGKDALVVCEDADLDVVTSAAVWGGFTNSGQVCASLERAIVHESVCDAFLEKVRTKMEKLRFGVELGSVTMPKQKEVYFKQLQDLEGREVQIHSGGVFVESENRFTPTLLSGPQVEQSLMYQEETFGPTLAVTRFKTDEEAIEKVNASKYGLVTNIYSKDLNRARAMAVRVETGTVIINEVLFTAGVPETPWGGVKDSGFGRTHGEDSLRDNCVTKHINEPIGFGWSMKSWWWFPYGKNQEDFFKHWIGFYRRGSLRRALRVPQAIFSLFRFLITERRW